MGMTESALRRYAEERDYPVTHDQFDAYVRAGLLPESDGGRWPEEIGDQLILVRRFGELIRPLPRRVILLRDNVRFPIEPDKLRRAMIDLISTVRQPIGKMKRVDAAVTYWAYLEANRGGGPLKGSSLPQGWRPPGVEQWKRILENAINVSPAMHIEGETPERYNEKERVAREMGLKYFDDRAGMQYYAWQSTLSASIAYTEFEMDDLLEEEVITLLTIRDLATWETIREQAKEREKRQQQIQEEIEREEQYFAVQRGKETAQ